MKCENINSVLLTQTVIKLKRKLKCIWSVSFGPWYSKCGRRQRRHISGNIHWAAWLYHGSVSVFPPFLMVLPCSSIDDIRLSLASLCLESISAGMWHVWLALSCVSDWKVKAWEIKQDWVRCGSFRADTRRWAMQTKNIRTKHSYSERYQNERNCSSVSRFGWSEWVKVCVLLSTGRGVRWEGLLYSAVAWLLLQS